MGYEELADTISDLLKERLGVHGKNLEHRLARAGRLLPRRIRQEARILVDAERFQPNPKLARRIDPGRVRAAFEVCEAYLKGIDSGKRRADRIIGILASAAFSLLVVAGLFLLVLIWRGLL